MRQPGCDWRLHPAFLCRQVQTYAAPKACSGSSYSLSFLSFSKAAITLAVATACDSPETRIRLSTSFSTSFWVESIQR